jgi:crotonobetainyl-CoA:carnitine CoA-transferase CaiB-like acyl-CoA transferase
VPAGVWIVIGGNGNSVYNRLIAAMGRPDMGIDNPKFATDAKRWENEKDILEVGCIAHGFERNPAARVDIQCCSALVLSCLTAAQHRPAASNPGVDW